MDLSLTLDLLLQVLMAITLAAATGLRAFLPLFLLSLWAHFFGLPLAENAQFLADGRAVFVFGLATLLEILADKIPALDNFLDTVNSFIKPILGVLAGYAVLSKLDPLLALVIAVAISGTVTLPTQTAKAGGRLASTLTSGGIANPIISLLEDVMSLALVVLAILLPVGALLLLVLIGYLVIRRHQAQAQRG